MALDKATNWTAGFSPADHGGSLPRTIKAAGGAIWSPYFGDVTEALITEAHGLGLRVVVEGIETEEQRQEVKALGAELAQGYLFGRPETLDNIMPRIQRAA